MQSAFRYLYNMSFDMDFKYGFLLCHEKNWSILSITVHWPRRCRKYFRAPFEQQPLAAKNTACHDGFRPRKLLQIFWVTVVWLLALLGATNMCMEALHG